MTPTGRDSPGFTLIEVLIALAITLISVAMVFRGVASSLRTADTTATWDRAMMWAQAHLAAIDDPGSALGVRQGEDEGGYRWRTRVVFQGAAPVRSRPLLGVWEHGTGLYFITVAIFWREHGAEQHFQLDSAELGPITGPAP